MPSAACSSAAGLGHGEDGRLARGVGDVALRARDAEDAGDVDDRAAADRPHRRIAACMPSSVPVALTASSSFQAASVSSSSGPTSMIPALFDERVQALAAATSAFQPSGTVTSSAGRRRHPRREGGGRLLAGRVEDVDAQRRPRPRGEPLGVGGALAAGRARDDGDATLDAARHDVTGSGAERGGATARERRRTRSMRGARVHVALPLVPATSIRASARLHLRTGPAPLPGRAELGHEPRLGRVTGSCGPRAAARPTKYGRSSPNGQRPPRHAQRHAATQRQRRRLQERERDLEARRIEDRLELRAGAVGEVERLPPVEALNAPATWTRPGG